MVYYAQFIKTRIKNLKIIRAMRLALLAKRKRAKKKQLELKKKAYKDKNKKGKGIAQW